MSNIRIGNDLVSVEVSPLGSEMQSIVTSDGQSWLWHGDATYWSGRSPVLFPMVGRSPNDQVSIEGQRYWMNQHGFARRSEFTLVDSGPDFCRFELVASEASKGMYPFDFALTLEHRVDGRAVVVRAEVSNRDRRPMPYGIGFHPAFRWPLPGCEGREHTVTLDNGRAPVLVRLSGGLVAPFAHPSPFKAGVLTLSPELFEADAMLFPEGAGAGLTYAAGDRAIRFSWDNLPNLAIWSKPGAPFVCLEPWHGTAAEVGENDALDERPYVEILEPGATGRYSFRAELVG